MKLEPLQTAGQIIAGDLLLLEMDGHVIEARAREVLNPGDDRNEEIIIAKRSNKFFITNMAIDGMSWAKHVHVVRAN